MGYTSVYCDNQTLICQSTFAYVGLLRLCVFCYSAHYMEKYETTSQSEDLPTELAGLIQELRNITDEDVVLKHINGTYEIDTNAFTLTFTLSETTFEIRSIDTHNNSGLGSKIITAIDEYAEQNDLEVIASNVRDGAEGFWDKMGYQESASDEGTFYRTGV